LKRLPAKPGKGDDNLPTRESLEKLQALATRKLREIVDKGTTRNANEIAAARELLAKADK
jgi:hypothetical protein